MLEEKSVLKIANVTKIATKILQTNCVPTPIYNETQQVKLIVKPRGTIFSKFRKIKKTKF